ENHMCRFSVERQSVRILRIARITFVLGGGSYFWNRR
ncbi:MAG: hypothetical protein ACI835_002976, partial [Planctomycetota bacterium]